MAGTGGKRPGSGRKKGSISEKQKALLERIQQKHKGYDPVIAMSDIANDESIPIDLRLSAHKEISKYIYPQLKAIETKDTSDNIKVYRVIYEDGGSDPAQTPAHKPG